MLSFFAFPSATFFKSLLLPPSSSSQAQLKTVRTLQPSITYILFHFCAMEAHGDAAAKRPAAADGAVADDVFAWLLVEDDGSEGELLNLLENGKDAVVEPASTVGRVRFIDDPYSSLLVFQSSSSYITINGNEESCGSSFSDSGTSVMASVDTNGLRKLVGSVEAFGKESSASASSNDTTREEVAVFGDGLDGFDEFDCEWDDEVLARFLGEGEGLFSENH